MAADFRTKILKDLLGGAAQSRPQPQAARKLALPQVPVTVLDSDAAAAFRIWKTCKTLPRTDAVRRLRHASTTTASTTTASTPATRSATDAATTSGASTSGTSPRHACLGFTRGSRPLPSSPQDQNEQAIVLIRAMVNAAKADGQVTQDEQQNLINQVGGTVRKRSSSCVTSLPSHWTSREFAWSVPMGMEEQVYTMSLTAIDLMRPRPTPAASWRMV